MQTIRRLYLYAVALVSLETVLWGGINFLRSLLTSGSRPGAAGLAQPLSLILVGTPVLLLHWVLIQRGVGRDPAERLARIRPVFLYSALLLALVPVVQNLLAILNRAWLAAFGLNPSQALIGAGQTWFDNLAAILINGIAALGVFFVLRRDQQVLPEDENRGEVGWLYRSLWLVYSLVLTIAGIQSVLQFTLAVWEGGIGPLGAQLASGLALFLVGAPIWWFVDELFQRGRSDPAWQHSLLRLVVLYALTLASLSGLLVSLGQVVAVVLRAVLGESMTPIGYLALVSRPVSFALPLGAVWAFYSRQLRSAIQTTLQKQATAAASAEQPTVPSRGFNELGAQSAHQAGLSRIYRYILSLISFLAVFAGLYLMLELLLRVAMGGEQPLSPTNRQSLANYLAMLVVGLPVWLACWRPAAREAAQEGEAGDHARRSIVRKGYLYLLLFASVIGLMATAGELVFTLLRSLFETPSSSLALDSAVGVMGLILFAASTAFHGLVLRRDARRSTRSLARRHAQFPVLVLAPEESTFASALLSALQGTAPSLPVAVHPYSQGAPDETLSAARAVILPAELITHPPEAVRLWLQGFGGSRLVVPTPARDWLWVSSSSLSLESLAHKTAATVLRLAEGEDLQPARDSRFWMSVIYVLAALFALQLILGLVASALSFLLQ